MDDANSFRHRLTPQNTTIPVHGKTVDERRSGSMGRDGYAVLSQARTQREPGWGSISGLGFENRNRPTMAPRVYDRGNFDYTE